MGIEEVIQQSQRAVWARDLFAALGLPGDADDLAEWDLFTRLEELGYTYCVDRGWLASTYRDDDEAEADTAANRADAGDHRPFAEYMDVTTLRRLRDVWNSGAIYPNHLLT